MTMSIEQCRAARALLDWSARGLADKAKLGVATVRRFEGGQVVQSGTIETMRRALESDGIVFIDDGQASRTGGAGVRLTSR